VGVEKKSTKDEKTKKKVSLFEQKVEKLKKKRQKDAKKAQVF
jgi:hypothetical protein